MDEIKKDGLSRRTLMMGAGALSAGIAAGGLAAPAVVRAQGTKTIRFLNTTASNFVALYER